MAFYSKNGLLFFGVVVILTIYDAQCHRQKKATKAVPHSLKDTLGNNTDQMISVLATQTQQIEHIVSSSTQMVSVLEAQSQQVKNLTAVVESMAALLAHSFPFLIKGLRLAAGDCSDIAAQGPYSSGVYTVTPWDDLGSKGAFKVYCDMGADDQVWTVFQRRINGSVDFYRDWDEYKNGFGDIDGEHWLGFNNLNRYMSTKGVSWQLKIELMDFEGNTAYALYDDFHIGDEASQFQLSIGSYSGTAGDSLSYHNGMKFSTKDRDNDNASGSCATTRKGGWWYGNCEHSNLNGPYLESAQSTHIAITWYHWKTRRIALKKALMKIRPIVQ